MSLEPRLGLPVHHHTLEVEVDFLKRSSFEGFWGQKKEIFKVKKGFMCIFWSQKCRFSANKVDCTGTQPPFKSPHMDPFLLLIAFYCFNAIYTHPLGLIILFESTGIFNLSSNTNIVFFLMASRTRFAVSRLASKIALHLAPIT